MKIATITLHDTDNCGSSLQAYALQYFLLSNGYENEIIDYVPKYTKNNGHPIKTIIRKILYSRETKERDRKFKEFINDNLILTSTHYQSLRQLRNNPPIADYYITGSDQLWNTMYQCGKDPAFYLDFVKGNKIAYAVSLGRKFVPDENLNLLRKYVKDFEWISVREKSSVIQIEKLGFSRKHIQYVCDPVLLNSVDSYNKLRCDRLISERYIVVYLAQDVDIELLEKCVQVIQDRINAKVVFVGSYRCKCTSDYHLRDMAPGEFLSLIYYADYIISNSFHATLFSIVYKKQFITVLPPGNSVRIEDILMAVGLEQRIITSLNITDLQDIERSEYSKVEEKIELMRKSSTEQLLLHLRFDT